MRLWLGDGGQPPRPKFIRNVNEVGSGGDWVKDGVWYSKADLGVSGDAVTLFIESVKASNSPADQQLKVELTYRQANGNYVGLGSDTVAFTSNGISLVPDYNRDGKIDGDDKGKWQAGQKFYFWTNTDDDEGETTGDDIPGKSIETPSLFSRVNPFSSPTGDAMTKSNGLGNISGVRDLIDYFPVHIDLGNMLNSLDLDEVDLVLRGPDINFALPDAETGAIDPLKCGDYLRVVDTAKKFAELEKTRTSGDKLLTYSNDPSKDRAFLEQVKLGKGVILLEGRVETDEPLVLEVYYKGNVIASTEMNLMISEVEDMYRHVNLVDDLDGPEIQTVRVSDRKGEPLNLPDSLSNGNNFVFVHGFKVDQEAARGWHSEFFKRLYQAGSNAKFTGVTWHGHTKGNYHKAVINAFITSRKLADELSFLTGDVIVGAHSLGNMLVSEAISHHDFRPTKYFLFNAAVPIEAYDKSISMESEMGHPDWQNYDTSLWASKWHELFPDDERRHLTWGGLFAAVLTNTDAYNFYTDGEDVVRNSDGKVPSLIGDILLNDGAYAWVMQEMSKGLDGPLGIHAYNLVMPDQHAGWQFNSEYDQSKLIPGMQLLDPIAAANIDPADLRIKPFFEPFIAQGKGQSVRFSTDYDGEKLLAPLGDADAHLFAGKEETKYKLLAEAIPAISFAAAANKMDIFNLHYNSDTRNIDMEIYRTDWPQIRLKDSKKLNDWLHSDLKTIAYPYVNQLYDRIIEEGELK